ncbi:MAG TPA: DUF1648 domain-containing protein [Ktedonobacterales bacterium]|nr:DUF1648 domain-containing protein [Ktedonobacterales bacterium]HVA62703.1 DUF1648 domain-containing protein [Terriglobales bacterium]
MAALGPLAVLGAAAWWLRQNWARIPPRFAIHWCLDGTPIGWAPRTFWGVYGILLLGAGVCLMLALMGYATLHWAHSPHGTADRAHRQATAWSLLAGGYMLAVAFAATALLPLTQNPHPLMIGIIIMVPLLLAGVSAPVVKVYRTPE